MITRVLPKVTVVLIAVGFGASASADPLDESSNVDMKAANIVLANLQKELSAPVLPNMSPRISAPEFVLEKQAQPVPLLQIAGRCGSSNYYCNETGATYCCGNSTDGFYCAADVNGCTR